VIHPLVPESTLVAALPPEARDSLDAMRAEVAADPHRLDRVFPAAARRTARGPLPGSDVLVQEAVRVTLLATAAERLTPTELLDELVALYRHGDSEEKGAVLLALGSQDNSAVDGTELLLDALRTNDTRLVAAAMGPHSVWLTGEAWRHGVLKCLFTGVPVAAIAGLTDRADAELAAMVRRYAREREAAGRDVPPDVQVVLDACPTDLAQEA
jgi:hypothetical protein